MRILVTCPPMLAQIDSFRTRFHEASVELVTPVVSQVMSEDELTGLVPGVDGWIIGDDPATARVLETGKQGRLRACVKWGIGIDNVDRQAMSSLNIPFTNTPGMFGQEVADLAFAYLVGLARHTHTIDRAVRAGGWPKIAGTSLAGKTVGLVGMGDIGRQISRRLLVAEMRVIGYDPGVAPEQVDCGVHLAQWPDHLGDLDFLVLACALTPSSKGMINETSLRQVKPGLRLVNVSRGGLVDEDALLAAMESRIVESVALDVFETEPFPLASRLRQFDGNIYGSHNASNTLEAVLRTSNRAIDTIFRFLGISGEA